MGASDRHLRRPPLLLLTATGRRSGTASAMPLVSSTDGDGLVIIVS
ncbi:MAG TPA: nitroreductase/quinone reductase family protein [Thermomicrobiales bacterium]|jgi:hypothetical protein